MLLVISFFQKKLINEKVENQVDPEVNLIDDEMLEFHEFAEIKYDNQWSGKSFLIYSIRNYILSIIFSYLI